MAVEHTHDDRLVVFFDVDDTLYSSSFKIGPAMIERLHAYMVSLGLSDETASTLRSQYYTQYGLTLRGLRRHHGVGSTIPPLHPGKALILYLVDPLAYDKECDASLPLEDLLIPDPYTRKLLEDIDRSKCRVWALTNANQPHAERVLSILKLRDQIEEIVFCDYADKNEDLICKPQPAFYHRAMEKAGINDPTRCLFVDDNLGNVKAARNLGWIRSVHFREHAPETNEVHVIHTDEDQKTTINDVTPVINNLQQLRELWPDIFLPIHQTQ